MADETTSLRDALKEYLPQVRLPPKASQSRPADHPWTVILTGSTGSLGSNILAVLQEYSPAEIRKVYCLNRSDAKKQREALNFRKLRQEQVSFMKVTFGNPRFGLSEQQFTQLQDEATLIIHAAWPVNFLMHFKEFKPHLEGVRDILYFAYSSPRRPLVLYISSCSVVYASDAHYIPEKIFYEFSTIRGGYSQSKYVAERMVDTYVRSTGLRAAVIRLGQLAGPVDIGGVWSHREWLPTLLRAARDIDALPTTLNSHNNIDWIPIDRASRTIVEIAEYLEAHQEAHPERFLVFNVANPKTVPFQELLPSLRDITANTVPAKHWVHLLEQAARHNTTRSPISGAKLLPFYQRIFTPGRSQIETETDNLRIASKTACKLPPVNPRWLEQWLEQWEYRSPRPHL